MNKITPFLVFGFISAICGSPAETDEDEWRIVGGSDAAEGEAPYQVYLKHNSGGLFCGGSIISARTIVTAAHCLVGLAVNEAHAVVGTLYSNSGGVSYSFNDVMYHPKYDPSVVRNDVGVVITSEDIEMNGFTVAPIALETSNIPSGESALLTGWGTTSYPGTIAIHLQKLEVNTLSVTECQNAFNGFGTVFDTQICTFIRTGQGACHGDSGGPLVVDGKLVGIVSWGHPCAIGYPDVFTRVSSYYDWINNHTIF